MNCKFKIFSVFESTIIKKLKNNYYLVLSISNYTYNVKINKINKFILCPHLNIQFYKYLTPTDFDDFHHQFLSRRINDFSIMIDLKKYDRCAYDNENIFYYNTVRKWCIQ